MHVDSVYLDQRREDALIYLRGADVEIEAQVYRHGELWKATMTVTTWNRDDTGPRQCIDIGNAYDGKREKVAQWLTTRLLDQLKAMGQCDV